MVASTSHFAAPTEDSDLANEETPSTGTVGRAVAAAFTECTLWLCRAPVE